MLLVGTWNWGALSCAGSACYGPPIRPNDCKPSYGPAKVRWDEMDQCTKCPRRDAQHKKCPHAGASGGGGGWDALFVAARSCQHRIHAIAWHAATLPAPGISVCTSPLLAMPTLLAAALLASHMHPRQRLARRRPAAPPQLAGRRCHAAPPPVWEAACCTVSLASQHALLLAAGSRLLMP